MSEYICNQCYNPIAEHTVNCPGCGQKLLFNGNDKNVLDKLVPNCLIYRYDGSDMLEPAMLVKACKTNAKVATNLRELAHPVTIPKDRIYYFDNSVYSSIQELRLQRTNIVRDFDQQIQAHWTKLTPYLF